MGDAHVLVRLNTHAIHALQVRAGTHWYRSSIHMCSHMHVLGEGKRRAQAQEVDATEQI
jgi:hypothetical protein